MEYSNKTVVGVDTAKQVFQLHWMIATLIFLSYNMAQ